MKPLSLKQIESHFGVNRKTVYRWMSLGMPYTQPVRGGKLFFHLDRVEKWFDRYQQPKSLASKIQSLRMVRKSQSHKEVQ